jgi:hypothetical protein
MKHGSERRWSRSSSAYLGAFLGMGIAMAHHAHHALVGEIPNENPLTHTFPELIGFTAAGALLLALMAEVRNRI